MAYGSALQSHLNSKVAGLSSAAKTRLTVFGQGLGLLAATPHPVLDELKNAGLVTQGFGGPVLSEEGVAAQVLP